MQITALPLKGANLKKFIEVANSKFEDLMQTMEPENPGFVRKLWNAEQYIKEVFRPDILPLDRDYALSLTEAFLVHHVIGLAIEADKEA